mgnify:CR=1 FL=1
MDKPIPKEIANQLEIIPNGSVKHKPKITKCDDCMRMVENRQVELRWRNPPSCLGHWASRCGECRMYANPDTGVYEFDLKQINAYFKP